jgi:hypothetical protein
MDVPDICTVAELLVREAEMMFFPGRDCNRVLGIQRDCNRVLKSQWDCNRVLKIQ